MFPPTHLHHAFATFNPELTGVDHRSLGCRAAGFPSPRAAEQRRTREFRRFRRAGAEGGSLEVAWAWLGCVCHDSEPAPIGLMYGIFTLHLVDI